jgi:AbrB family looped-hinge helix DNA binding protein
MKSSVSEKGQVTIPKRLRDRLGIKRGQLLEFFEERGRLVVVKKSMSDSLEEVYGILKTRVSSDRLIERLRGRADTIDQDS